MVKAISLFAGAGGCSLGFSPGQTHEEDLQNIPTS